MRPSPVHVWNVLRGGAALCFIGHGAFGLLRKDAWLPFFAFAGVDAETARMLMPLIGGADIAAGILAIVSPRPAVFAYMVVWATWTAALRPLTGDSFAELLERAGNYGVPVALLLLASPGRSIRAWLAPVPTARGGSFAAANVGPVLVATSAMLLAGHGMIGLAGSPLLAGHYEALGLDAGIVTTVGLIEICSALALALRPAVPLAVGIAIWKLASESLFLVAGAPVWEFIERGGSYAAPIALTISLSLTQQARTRPAFLSGRPVAVLLAAVLALGTPAWLGAQASDRATLTDLRAGGIVLACRHARTVPDQSDAGPERTQQRNLSAEGEAEARQMGEVIRALNLPIGEVLSSQLFRTRETANAMFGRATVTPLLRMTPDTLATLRLFTDHPESGTIRVLVTHNGVLARHFRGTAYQQVPEGGCVLVRPDGGETPRPVTMITAPGWQRLLAADK